MTTRARPLVHSRVDGWLLGGVGVVAWLVVGPLAGARLGAISGWVTWAFLVVSAMHFGASYHLAYAGGRRALREHPWALVIAPIVLLGAAAAVTAVAAAGSARAAGPLLRFLLVTVFTLTGWHYIKQAYGVAMLSVRSRRLPMRRTEALALRYSLYPVWAYEVLNVYGRSSTARYLRFDVSVAVVPQSVQRVIEAAALAAAAVASVLVIRLAVRLRGVPPAGLWATYLAAVLWFVAPPSYVSAGLVLGGIHGLQYLPCAHRAELDRAVEQGERHLTTWWLCVFGGAVAGGLLVTSSLPSALERARLVPTMPALFAALIFVVINLHHYAIDATIWRAGGEHVRRIAHGPDLGERPAGGHQSEGSSIDPVAAASFA